MRRALISNDDGVHSAGLAALARAAEAAGFTPYVVAPDREQSASSHALTLHRPLRVVKTAERTWVVDGTPTDCVNLALCRILKDTPVDLVLSGINSGANLGDDIGYSGTVACAFEGTLLGVPSIALSLDYRRDGAEVPDYTEAERIAGEVIQLSVENPLPNGTLWNVNIPPGVPRGMRATRMGKRRYGESVVEKLDPRGRPYFWIGGEVIDDLSDGNDLIALSEHFVSITPLHLDLTDYRALVDLGLLLERRREAQGTSPSETARTGPKIPG